MSKIKSFFRQYKYEFIAFIVNVISASLSILLTTPQLAFVIAVIVFTLSMFVVIYFRTKDRDFYFLPLDKPGSDSDWVGRGAFKFIKNEMCYEITGSSVGFIYPKTALWDDYVLECDFKIIKTSLGVIFRAQNLSNCVMIQLFNDRIKSHLRVNGEWIVYGDDKTSTNLGVDNWYKLKAYCEKRKIRINIFSGESELLDRHITIPDTIAVVVKQEPSESKESKDEIKQILNIDFDFGSIGFRNFGNESALVKNVFMEKL